jgi:tetratricopeptide (TPR) repeat protein
MSELQAKYADQKVDVIGVSIWERKPGAVKPFVKQRDENDKQGDEMAYRVAMDAVPPLPEGVEEGSPEAAANAGKGKMAVSWMDAAGRNGIPTVFIVDREGRVAWIGHPMDGMDEALAKIVDGSFDLDAARQAEAREQAAMEVAGKYGEKLRQGDLAGAQELLRAELEGPLWERPDLLNFVAWTLVDPKNKLEGQRDLDLALKAAERANELTKGEDASTLDTLARVHFTRGDVDRAVALQRDAVAKAPLSQKAALEKILEEYEAAGQQGGTR